MPRITRMGATASDLSAASVAISNTLGKFSNFQGGYEQEPRCFRPLIVATKNMLLISAVLLIAHAILLQSPQILTLKRFEVIRVTSDDMRRLPNSMRTIFVDPVPDGVQVDNIEEAAKRAGFTPRVLKGKAPKRVFITNVVNSEVTINVEALAAALRDAKLQDITVPADWDGVNLELQQAPGILIDYGDFYIAQGPPRTLTTPPGFAIGKCLEVMFRLMGISTPDAGVLRDSFAANASTYLPIAPRFDMDIRQVSLPSGSGLLLQNADKGGELAFMWSTGDRSYFLTGLVAEDEVIALAKTLQ